MTQDEDLLRSRNYPVSSDFQTALVQNSTCTNPRNFQGGVGIVCTLDEPKLSKIYHVIFAIASLGRRRGDNFGDERRSTG